MESLKKPVVSKAIKNDDYGFNLGLPAASVKEPSDPSVSTRKQTKYGHSIVHTKPVATGKESRYSEYTAFDKARVEQRFYESPGNNEMSRKSSF